MKNNFTVDGDEITVKINKNIYPKDVLVQATYVLLDKFYFLIDENESEYIVSMKCRTKSKDDNYEKFVYEFFDELIESASYIDQLKRTSKVRETILEKALLSQKTNDDEEKKN